VLSPFLALPRLPPRPDVYARQHSLTRQAVCVCVRCVARPCVCVCVGRKRRCSQALSTCSRSYRAAFRLRALVPAPRACAPSTLLRRSHHPTDLMPTLSRSASAPLARDSVLVSPVLLSSSAFPTSSLRASRPHDARCLCSLFCISFSAGALHRHASCSAHSPKCQGHSLPWDSSP
jgi:hypothetical protein